ncbi:MAG TPA: SLBB domain-containing protein, partial [Chthonomonadaceae bacterium]|nr:SLBB domain-containing protein [Chthonomonadaceae bacterium]
MNNRFPTPKGFIAPTLSLVALMGLACWLPMRIAAQTQPPTPPNTTPDKTTKTDTKSDMNTDGSKSDMKTDKKPDQKNNGQSDKNDSQSDKNKDDKSGLKPGDTPGRREAPNPVILNDDHLPHILTPNSKSTLKDHQDHTDSGRPEGPKGKDLPLYGYDFFKPQRDAIEQYRAFVKQLREEQLRMRSGIYPAPMNNGNNGMGNNGTPGNPNETNLQNPGNGSLGNINPSQLSSLTPAQIAALPPGLLNNAGQANTPRSGGTPVSGATGSNPITDGNSSLDSGGNQGFANPGNTFQGTPYRSGDPNSQPVFNAFNQTVDPITAMLFPVNATPPADYKLGPGDSIKIQYSSPTLDNTVTIDRSIEANGSVMIGQGLAPVNLTGKTLEAAEKALTTQLRRYYNNVQVNITLNRLRTIQVTISGKAYLPGSYSVPAVATAYNMVYASGGPTEEGTLRGIQVRRQGRIIATLDMYKFEQGLQGDPDVPLQSGDIIVIPPHKSRISISGEVLSENVFELLPEESLADALNFAGGVKPSAVSQRIQISSVDPGQDRIIRDVDLKKPGADKTTVYDGDFVSVLSVRALFANTVKIEGAVDQPSDYALTPGMKVSDLLERARGLLNEAFPIADLHRWQPDNTDAMKRIDLVKALAHDPENDVVLTKWDRIKVYTRDEVAWTGHRIVTVNGAVKKYGTYTHSQNMRVSDLLRMAGGPMPDAYLERAILIHQHDDGPPSLEYVNLNAVIKGDKDKDLLLQDNDNLAVYAVGQAQFTP